MSSAIAIQVLFQVVKENILYYVSVCYKSVHYILSVFSAKPFTWSSTTHSTVYIKKTSLSRSRRPRGLRGGSYDVHGYAYFFQAGVQKNLMSVVSEFRSAKIRFCACVQTRISIQTSLDRVVKPV